MPQENDAAKPKYPAIGDDYKIFAKLGEGAFGEVYKAHHGLLEQDFAVKLLRPELCEDKEVRARFLDEARALIRFSHPNVVQMRHVGEYDGRLFLVMDFMEGEELTELMKREGPLSEARALNLIKQILSGLESAHAAGIVHRDLKPSNILVNKAPDGSEKISILDFGLSKFSSLDGVAGAHRSITGTIVGTLAYMSPEQIKGDRDIDGRSDLFAVGLILQEMLQGHHPYPGDSGIVVAAKLLRDPIPPIEGKPASEVTDMTKGALARALERDRDARFASVTAFAQSLDGKGPPSDTSRVTTIMETTQELARQEAQAARRAATAKPKGGSKVLVGAIALVAVAAAAFFLFGQGDDPAGDGAKTVASGGGTPGTKSGGTPSAGTGGEQPGGTTEQPGGTTEQPGGTTEQPGGTSEQPGGTSEQPGGTTEQPGGTTEQPGGTTEQPGGTTEQPGGTTEQPGGTTEQPGGTTEQPGGTTEQPGGTTEQPGGTTEQPGGTTEQPGGTTEQPGGTTEQPGGTAEQPGGTTEQPGGATEKPTPEACCEKASPLFAAGDWAKARTWYQAATVEAPPTGDLQLRALRRAAEAWVEQADELARAGKIDAALEELAKAVTWLQARHQAYSSMPRAAQEARLQLGFSRMHEAEAHVEIARWLRVKGDTAAAAAEMKLAEIAYDFALDQLRRDGVRYWEFLIRRAEMYRLQGKSDKMIEDVNHTTKTKDQKVPAHMWVAHARAARRVAQAWLANDNRKEALAWAKQALKVAEDGVSWKDVELTRQQWLEMTRVLFAVAAIAPDSEDPTALHGKVRYWVTEAGKKKKAPWVNADVAEARLLTGQAMERTLKGLVHKRSGKAEEAQRAFGEASAKLDEAIRLRKAAAAKGLRLEGSLPYEVRAFVATVQGQSGEASAAMAAARKASARNPD